MIPLANAYLCSECDLIGDQSDACPKCASKGLLALARVLNRSAREVDWPEFCDLMKYYRHFPPWLEQPATVDTACEAIEAWLQRHAAMGGSVKNH